MYYVSVYIIYTVYTRISLVAQMVKASAYNVGDLGSIPGSGRLPGEGNGYSLQYSGLENSMDHIGIAGSRLSDFHFHYGPFVLY